MTSHSQILDAELQMSFDLISENTCVIGEAAVDEIGEEANINRFTTICLGFILADYALWKTPYNCNYHKNTHSRIRIAHVDPENFKVFLTRTTAWDTFQNTVVLHSPKKKKNREIGKE